MRYQDIQIPDKELWQQYRWLMQNNHVDQAQQLLANAQLSDKGLTASNLNALTDAIVSTERLNDSNFKADRIKVGDVIPDSLAVGDVFFLTGPDNGVMESTFNFNGEPVRYIVGQRWGEFMGSTYYRNSILYDYLTDSGNFISYNLGHTLAIDGAFPKVTDKIISGGNYYDEE